MVFAVVLVVFMIRSTLSGAKDKNNITSIYFKILMNHIQLILMTASFKFSWPTVVTDFFDIAKPIASASTQVMSFDCFLYSYSGSSANSNTTKVIPTSYVQPEISAFRIYFLKLIMLAMLPLLLAGLSFGVWNLHKLIKGIKTSVHGKSLSTLVIILFLIHPNIVQYMFFNFKCIDVDGDTRV